MIQIIQLQMSLFNPWALMTNNFMLSYPVILVLILDQLLDYCQIDN